MSELKARPVGIFDSGVGGLTVLREIMRELPSERVIYFGDTARFPYGPRSDIELQEFVFEIVDFLLAKDVKIIVSACNSSSAVALEAAQEHFPIKFLGVIAPGARAAIRASKKRCIGIIGTPATIDSHSYTNALRSLDPTVQVVPQRTPDLAEFVERGEFRSARLIERLQWYLAPLLAADIDSLILGCTHYPSLSQPIKEIVGERIAVISSARETATELRQQLDADKLLREDKEPDYSFFATGDKGNFLTTGQRFLGRVIDHVEQVTIQRTPAGVIAEHESPGRSGLARRIR